MVSYIPAACRGIVKILLKEAETVSTASLCLQSLLVVCIRLCQCTYHLAYHLLQPQPAVIVTEALHTIVAEAKCRVGPPPS